jgi:hypothetical protein
MTIRAICDPGGIESRVLTKFRILEITQHYSKISRN